MKEIPLTQGKVALVDDDMYDYLMQWKWHAHCYGNNIWYARRNEGLIPFRKTVDMHQVIITSPPGYKIDHRNRDGLDNRRENLRVCTNSENQANRGVPANNKTGYKGVHWSKRERKYRAQIRVNSKHYDLGTFDNPIDAAKAYDAAAKEHFGEFAWTNF